MKCVFKVCFQRHSWCSAESCGQGDRGTQWILPLPLLHWSWVQLQEALSLLEERWKETDRWRFLGMTTAAPSNRNVSAIFPTVVQAAFPYGYKRLICLDIAKCLVVLWRTVPSDGILLLSSANIFRVNDKITRLWKLLRCEFPRRRQTFADTDYWRSVEYRQFLLHVGRVIMKDLLPMEHCKLFFAFSICSYILCSTNSCIHYVDYMQCHTRTMIQRPTDLHEDHGSGHSFHMWNRVRDDIKEHGNLGIFSASLQESYMQVICRCATSRHIVAEHKIRRITERYSRAGLQTDIPFWDDSFHSVWCSDQPRLKRSLNWWVRYLPRNHPTMRPSMGTGHVLLSMLTVTVLLADITSELLIFFKSQ